MLHGERLDRPTYTVLQSQHLDGGNTGVVVLTHHEVFGVDVVQKTVSLLGIPDALARSEPRILEELRHENLIRVREAQWDPEFDRTLACVTFTTDYYPGRCVHHALTTGHRFSVGDVISVIEGLLSACVYLHDSRRMMHRDIKPANVMLDGDRVHAYLGDLGSAARLDEDDTVEATGNTPLYRAPEGASGKLDVRADLYGIGCVMLEMLNGPVDYADVDRDKVDDRIARGRRALTDRHYAPAPWVPDKVARFVRKLVAADPGDRFATAREALRVLRGIAYVSWQRISGDGLLGTWSGTYPPQVPAARARTYEVTASAIGSGKYKGRVLLVARSRRSDAADWRNLASLTRRVQADDAKALAGFFRDVEAAAQAAPTP